MKKLLLIALASSAMSAHAWDPNFYAGSNFSTWQLTAAAPDIDSNFNLWTLEAVGGFKLFPYVGLEGRAGFGINSDTGRRGAGVDAEDMPIEGQPIEIGGNYFGSLYFRPVIENERASLYGLLGYTTMEADITEDDITSAGSFDGLSLGMGVSFVMTPNVNFHAEWKQLVNSDDIRIRGASAGFTYKF